ncbi:hypothetical protein [Pseudonocardia spinosispora]|uniref:hypothetical protein n=1 Tax=Pseudonocardia spinosispora TaxID=103441 RepID=UPI0004137987|nr:hypothetical protein [Pseudonocardia spinosispora]
MTLVVDAANVVGSRPDGWWRDRAGAAARLVAAVEAALEAGTLDGPVLVVVEGAARPGVAEGRIGAGLTVVHAERDGDSTIVEQVAALTRDGASTVITADRGLRDRVLAEGASVLGPSWLLDRI